MNYAQPNMYASVASKLEQDSAFQGIVAQRIKVPHTENWILDPFAPALIPLWSTGSRTIVGFWKHWFTKNRKSTFVEYEGKIIYGASNIVFEKARTFEQLVCDHIMDCICTREGIDTEIERFASEVSLQNVEELDELSQQDGDLTIRPEFKVDLPLAFYDEGLGLSKKDYTGDFPHEDLELTPKLVEDWCVFEVHSGYKDLKPDYAFRQKVASSDFAPPWFTTSSQRDTFFSLLESGNLSGAWMCLNSPGWILRDARKAIKKLAAKANDSVFSEVADTWAGLPFPDDEEY